MRPRLSSIVSVACICSVPMCCICPKSQATAVTLVIGASSDFQRCCIQQDSQTQEKRNDTLILSLELNERGKRTEFPLGAKFSKYLRQLVDTKNRISDNNVINTELNVKSGFSGMYLKVDGVLYGWAGASLIEYRGDSVISLYRDSSQLLHYILRYFINERLRLQKRIKGAAEIYKNIFIGIELQFDKVDPFKGSSTVAE